MIERVTKKFFSSQDKEILRVIESSDDLKSLANPLALISQTEAPEAPLLDLLMPAFLEVAGLGFREFVIKAKPNQKSRFYGAQVTKATSLGDDIRDKLTVDVDRANDRGMWSKVQLASFAFVASVIERTIRAGKVSAEVVDKVKESLRSVSAYRAEAIAITEATAHSNLGADYAASNSRLENGLMFKQWVTRGDEKVRTDHQMLSGISISYEEGFLVGSTKAPYPCHHSLPAKQRVNCRCHVVYHA